MATKATTLFSLAAVKSYLEIENDDADLNAVLTTIADGVSDRIERMTGRTFVTRSITEIFDARGRTFAFLKTLPVASLTTVRIRASLSDAWEDVSDDAVLDTEIGQVHLAEGQFYAGPMTAEFVYSAGYGAQDNAALPSDAVQAALDYVTFVWKRKQAGLIMAGSSSIGGQSIMVVPEPPKDLRDTIMNLRKLRGVALG